MNHLFSLALVITHHHSIENIPMMIPLTSLTPRCFCTILLAAAAAWVCVRRCEDEEVQLLELPPPPCDNDEEKNSRKVESKSTPLRRKRDLST